MEPQHPPPPEQTHCTVITRGFSCTPTQFIWQYWTQKPQRAPVTPRPPTPTPLKPACAWSVCSCGLLIQHLSHFGAAFAQLAFSRRGFKLVYSYTCRHTNSAPRADITPHCRFLPKIQAPTLGNYPEPVQPPGHEIHTPGKQLWWVEGV